MWTRPASMLPTQAAVLAFASIVAASSSAWAAPAGGEAEASGSASISSSETNTSTSRSRRGKTGTHPLRMFVPRAGVAELSIYGGIYLPPGTHSYGAGGGAQRLDVVMGSLGGRVGYYPLSWLGFEGEIGGFPGSVRDGGYVQLIHARGHALFQLPFRLTPFLLGGMGTLIVNDDADRLGTEQDPAAHIGAGGRFYVNDWFNLRLEWRGTLAPRSDGATNRSPSLHNEILLSLGFVFGPKHREAPAPPAQAVDGDGDGFLEPADKCPNEPGVAPDGCPPADRDGDGFDNEVDACPDDPGIAPDGCPTKDRDKDGITDENDLCIDEPGIEPDGCPIKDSDGDQILDPDDKCPNEPETRNGFEDTDGCPDEVPEEVVKFTGVIQGIYFAVNRAALKSESYAVLKEAVEVLKKHPTIRIEVVGHTDSTGDDAHNRKLSQERAEAVRQYLTENGIEADRIEARGVGENEPIASNSTKAGRAENRRTEFHILSK